LGAIVEGKRLYSIDIGVSDLMGRDLCCNCYGYVNIVEVLYFEDNGMKLVSCILEMVVGPNTTSQNRLVR